MKVLSQSIKGLRRYGSLKIFKQKHLDAEMAADTGVITIALPVLPTSELKKMFHPCYIILRIQRLIEKHAVSSRYLEH